MNVYEKNWLRFFCFVGEKYEILFNIEQKSVLLKSGTTKFQYYLIVVLNYKGIVLFYAC